MVGMQGLNHGSAHEARHDGDIWQGQRDDGADHVHKCAIIPPTDRQPFQPQAEEQLDYGCDYISWHRGACGGEADDGEICREVLAQGCDDSEDSTQHQRQKKCSEAQGQ